MMEPKRCPFCNSRRIGVKRMDEDDFRMECYHCHSAGSPGFTEEDAVERWNTRYKENNQCN